MNNFSKLNDNIVKQNYNFIVKQYYCLQHGLCSGPKNTRKTQWDVILQKHNPLSHPIGAKSPRGKENQSLNLFISMEDITSDFQVNSRPCNGASC
jgi:hypothetical protein